MLPIALQNHIAAISEQFGGYKAVENLLPKRQLYYLSLFPGPFFVTAPWVLYSSQFESYAPDLNLGGHISGELYKVYNREMVFLFKGRSRLFGESQQEKLLINSAYHGEFFHLELTTAVGPRLTVLWISKQIPSTVQERVNRKARELTHPISRTTHEIFISTEGFDKVTIYSYQGPTKQDALDLTQYGDSVVTEVRNGRTARLTPKVNTWYVFVSDGEFLKASVTGEGEHRWKTSGDIHQFEAQNKYLVGQDRLDVTAFTKGRQSQANLFGKLYRATTVEGSSLLTAIASTPTNILLDAEIIRKEVGLASNFPSSHETNSDLAIRSAVITTGSIEGASQGVSSGQVTSQSTVSGSISGRSASSSGEMTSKVTTFGTVLIEPSLVSTFSHEFEGEAYETYMSPRSTGLFTSQIGQVRLTLDSTSVSFDSTQDTLDEDTV